MLVISCTCALVIFSIFIFIALNTIIAPAHSTFLQTSQLCAAVFVRHDKIKNRPGSPDIGFLKTLLACVDGTTATEFSSLIEAKSKTCKIPSAVKTTTRTLFKSTRTMFEVKTFSQRILFIETSSIDNNLGFF